MSFIGWASQKATPMRTRLQQVWLNKEFGQTNTTPGLMLKVHCV